MAIKIIENENGTVTEKTSREANQKTVHPEKTHCLFDTCAVNFG